LRRGFAFGLGQQRIEVVERFAQFGTRVEKQLQSLFVSVVGGRHVVLLVRLMTLDCQSALCLSRYKSSKAERYFDAAVIQSAFS
jgi:hypothetical protein